MCTDQQVEHHRRIWNDDNWDHKMRQHVIILGEECSSLKMEIRNSNKQEKKVTIQYIDNDP